ncbi:hypothetical protein G8A07_12135 [Roseateles sp. DAIF2]|uniref:SIR2 family protein n=1 Tax=Roseateles sp. DAIF2 TaxID=2714952 RepID=UPI0018A26360|nr:SIR2 family protein [Roseateles sp. DAIF2]QPF73597.1 hypothetical protein G8A07_12135 [Roseateles sp. DAIF2]
MRQLTILGGAGINLGISHACPEADEMLSFTYQKISTSVYSKIDAEVKAMFTPESFDYILGGLLTVNLAIEKTKQDLKRFNMNEAAFAELFRQSSLQASIASALSSIEEQLTISLGQILGVIDQFRPAVDKIFSKYDSINYYTVNFDGIFDHVLYGKGYSRGKDVTDFWWPSGDLDHKIDRRAKIFHLHGDLRYKPFKKTKNNNPPYKWPVLVVGDHEVKMGIITSNESLRFYNNRFKATCESRGPYQENNLAVIGFGFREEDEHIVNRLKHGIANKTFDSISLFDVEDRLSNVTDKYTWKRPEDQSLIQFIDSL